MESCKRKGNRVPLPYLIRPRKRLPIYDSFALYNDYIEYSSIDDGLDYESDDDDSSMEPVVTSSLEKKGQALNDETDEEYVAVDNVEPLPNSKTEKAGAIQMMELSKDAVDESESEDTGSGSDDWVVV